jgi:hypothetical protein
MEEMFPRNLLGRECAIKDANIASLLREIEHGEGRLCFPIFDDDFERTAVMPAIADLGADPVLFKNIPVVFPDFEPRAQLFIVIAVIAPICTNLASHCVLYNCKFLALRRFSINHSLFILVKQREARLRRTMLLLKYTRFGINLLLG